VKYCISASCCIKVSLGLLYVPSTMQRQLIGHNSLHNTSVVYV
jgi:hypothetical protein